MAKDSDTASGRMRWPPVLTLPVNCQYRLPFDALCFDF